MEKIEYRNCKIEISRDDDPPNPRKEWDNLGIMVCFHRRYNLGDKDHKQGKSMNFSDSEELIEFLEETPCILLPLFLYDHSGITMNTTEFSCPWDSGQVGIIFVEKWRLRKIYSWKRISAKRQRQAEGYLRAEVKVYDQYLRGDTYWYTILDSEDEPVDSPSDRFGYDYTVGEAKRAVDWFCDKHNHDKGDEHVEPE